jgi:hypothetical protein
MHCAFTHIRFEAMHASYAFKRSYAMPFDPVPRNGFRTLARRDVVVLDNAEGTVIAVDSGCLWITMERDSRDIMLVAGMRFEIDRHGRTVVVAEEDSRIRVYAPVDAHGSIGDWAARMADWAVARADQLANAWEQRLTRQRVPYC